jgi:hypothetical protein
MRNDDGRVLVAGVLGLVAVAGIMTRRSGSRLVLGDLARVEKGLEGADFWLDAKGKPTRTRGEKFVGVKVTRTDMLVPNYLFYVFEYLVMQGTWRGRKVTPESVRALQFDVQDDRPPRGSAVEGQMRELSVVLEEASSVAMAAARTEWSEKVRLVNRLRRLWQEAERIGFPIEDEGVEFVRHQIGKLDLRRGNPSSELRESIAPSLNAMARCARWAAVVRKS